MYKRYVAVLFLLLLLTLLTACGSTQTTEGWELSSYDRATLGQLFSEENWTKMSELFETVEDSLDRFIAHLKEYEPFGTTYTVSIQFQEDSRFDPDGGAFAIVDYVDGNNERTLTNSTSGFLNLVGGDNEFYNIIREIRAQGVLSSIHIRAYTSPAHTEFWASFSINVEYTPFTVAINNAPNSFRYIIRDNPERHGNRNIRDNWYMEITRLMHS